jgi:hypothetical protein
MPIRRQDRIEQDLAAVTKLHVTFYKMCRSTEIQDVVAYSEGRLWLRKRSIAV